MASLVVEREYSSCVERKMICFHSVFLTGSDRVPVFGWSQTRVGQSAGRLFSFSECAILAYDHSTKSHGRSTSSCQPHLLQCSRSSIVFIEGDSSDQTARGYSAQSRVQSCLRSVRKHQQQTVEYSFTGPSCSLFTLPSKALGFPCFSP